MEKVVCSGCKRVQLGTENYSDGRISHTTCVKCLLGQVDDIGASLSELLDPALKNDPRVMDAREFVKGSIQIERKGDVKWIDNGWKYSEEIERLYDILVEEVNREAVEARGEIKRM
jgi:hypothetical protein